MLPIFPPEMKLTIPLAPSKNIFDVWFPTVNPPTFRWLKTLESKGLCMFPGGGLRGSGWIAAKELLNPKEKKIIPRERATLFNLFNSICLLYQKFDLISYAHRLLFETH